MDVNIYSKFVSMILAFTFFSLVSSISVGAIGLSYSDKNIQGVAGTNISYPIWISNSKDSSVDVNYHYDFQGYTMEEVYSVGANSNRKVVQTIQVPEEIGEYNPYFEISVSGGEGGTSSISTRVTLTVNLQAVEETTTTTSSTTTTTSSTTTTTTTQPPTTTTTTTSSSSGSGGGGDTTTTTSSTTTTTFDNDSSESGNSTITTTTQVNETMTNQTNQTNQTGGESTDGGSGFPWDYLIGGIIVAILAIVLVYYRFFYTGKVEF